MLKYENIVNRLEEGAKIDLLSNLGRMTEEEFMGVGIPSFRLSSLKRITAGVYPSEAVLARSWDTALVSEISADAARELSVSGSDLVLTPSAKIMLDPYLDGATDDLCLARELSKAYSEGAESAGVASLVKGPSLTKDDLRISGKNVDRDVLSEYLLSPYAANESEEKKFSVSVGEASLRGSTENFDLFCIDGVDARFKLCEYADADNTVKYVNKGVICLEGAGFAIKAALRKYTKIKLAVDRGELDITELEDEVENGRAISPETVDAAVDRVIDLIYSCKDRSAKISAIRARKDIALDAARSSIIMLENSRHLLPLSKKKKVAIVGDLAALSNSDGAAELTADLERRGYVVYGVAQGYDMSSELPNAKLTDEALAIADRADVVLLLLGLDSQREKYVLRTRNLTLPANQEILAEELGEKFANKTVAIVSSEHMLDVSGLSSLSALILAKADKSEALADVLSGEYNPSGRLCCSLPEAIDRSVEKRAGELASRMVMGRFIGYRYYDSSEINVAYPLGYGLSYTKFEYSAFKLIGRDKLSLRLTNTGKARGAEVVQLYAGFCDRTALRPRRELIAFEKVELDPGESKTVELDVNLPRVMYDGRFVIQEGEYRLFVASSLTDTKHTFKIYVNGQEIVSEKEALTRYLLSESNILTENYTLEARYPTMKKAIKNIFGGLALLLIAVALQVYSVATNSSSTFLNVMTVVVLDVAVSFFVIDAIDRKRMAQKESEIAEQANKELFDDSVKLDALSVEKMFADEKEVVSSEDDGGEQEEEIEEKEQDFLAYVDKDFDIAKATAEFEHFALERGCKIDADGVRKLFASVSSARLIIFNALSDNEFERLFATLCEYFECNVNIDRTMDNESEESDGFYRVDTNGNRIKSALTRTLEEAEASATELHLCGFSKVKADTAEDRIARACGYANNHASFVAMGKDGTKYRFARNILFAVSLDGVLVDELPEQLLTGAAICDLKLSLVDKAATLTHITKLKNYQLEYMIATTVDQIDPDESRWKKLDEFERSLENYTIGNKLWLSLEKYISAYIACGGSVADAYDNAIAALLIPTVISCTEDLHWLSGEVERIFGAESGEAISRTIKTATISRTGKQS